MPPKVNSQKPTNSGSPKTTKSCIPKQQSRYSERIATSQQSTLPGSPKPKKATNSGDEAINVDRLSKDIKEPENATDETKPSKNCCPCGKSSLGQCWVLTCNDCKQAWHQACAGLKAELAKTAIDSLLKSWQCPWCFTCPYIKPNSHLSNINTKKAQENVIAAATVQSITDSIAEENRKLSDMILHLEDRIGAVTSDIDAVRGTQNAISEKVLKINDIETHIQHQILSQESLNQKMKSLQTTLAVIQEDISKLSQNIPQQEVLPTPTPSSHITEEPSLSDVVSHDQEAMSEMKEEFIDETCANALSSFLDSLSFTAENGHSVTAFGSPYRYTGSRSSDVAQEVPDELKPLLEKVNNLQKEVFYHQYPDSRKYNRLHPEINSILINRYEGTESFLPKHSDDEDTVHPESHIFTLSVGAKCNIDFTPKSPHDSESTSSVSCPHRSLYTMSRKSQDFYAHEIKPGQTETGIRFSLTFRSVSRWNKNSTCVVGDSNTGSLNFGTDKRKTFGEMMPGHRFWAPKIESIVPSMCCSYSNVVIMCGINNIKHHSVNGPSDIDAIYQLYYTKLAEIRKLNPKCKIYVCPILPTKCHQLNRGALYFNSLIFDQLTLGDLRVQYVQGFNSFLEDDGSGLLSRRLSRQVDRNNQPDMLHLNISGVRKLAGFIKQSIFGRLRSTGNSRRHTNSASNQVNGRPYASVVGSSSPAGDSMRPPGT